jgi:hypothetical protein
MKYIINAIVGHEMMRRRRRRWWWWWWFYTGPQQIGIGK